MMLWVCVLAVLASALAKDPKPVCTFKADPNPTWVSGQTTMTCTCTPAASQTWIYPLNAASEWDQTRTFALDKALVLSPVKASDKGRYQCWAKFSYPDKDFEGGNQVFENLDLDLLDPPEKTDVEVDPDTVNEGETFTIRCTQKGGDAPTKYTIYRKDSSGNTAVFREIPVTDGRMMVEFNIPNAKEEDHEGTYSCKSENPAGETDPTDEDELEVIEPPEKTEVEVDPDTVDEGETFTIRCTQKGGDSPTKYTIYREDSDGNKAVFREIPVTDGRMMVEFNVPNAKEEDHEGTYTCTSENPAGESDPENDDELEVIEPPEKTEVEVDPDTVDEGETFTIRCTQKGGDSPTKYTIYREDSDGNKAVFREIPVSDGRMMVEFNVPNAKEEDHEGTYTCTSENTAGESKPENDDELEVIEPPEKTEVEVDPDTVNEGETFTIRCTQKGGDSPTKYTIYREDSDGNKAVFREIPVTDGRLMVEFNVPNAKEEDHEGTYTCTSENTAGKSDPTNDEDLEVIEPPKETEIDVDPNVVNEEDPVTIRCTQKGGDAPTKYTIYKEDEAGNKVVFKEIPVTDGRMMVDFNIPNAKEDDHEGTYSCKSENTAGETDPTDEEDLEVRNEPDKVTLTITPNPVKECQNVMMKAIVVNDDPTAMYTFRKTDGSKTIESEDPQITIPEVSPEDAGTWVVDGKGLDGDTTTSQQEQLVVQDPTMEFETDNCDSRKYLFNSCKKTRAEALDYCTDKGMKLAAYLDKEELKQVYDNIKATWPAAAEDPFWTGYSRSSPSNPWTDGACSSAPVFPDLSSYTTGNCVISKGASNFDARNCDERHAFVCMKADCDVDIPNITWQDDKYVVFNRKVDRERAEDICQDLGMQLFSINSMSEMQGVCDPLLEQKLSTTPYWTGPKEDGDKYVDYCGTEVPASVMGAFKDDPNITDPKCTILKNDLYFAKPCPDTCVGFICEKNAEGC